MYGDKVYFGLPFQKFPSVIVRTHGRGPGGGSVWQTFVHMAADHEHRTKQEPGVGMAYDLQRPITRDLLALARHQLLKSSTAFEVTSWGQGLKM